MGITRTRKTRKEQQNTKRHDHSFVKKSFILKQKTHQGHPDRLEKSVVALPRLQSGVLERSMDSPVVEKSGGTWRSPCRAKAASEFS